MLARQDIQVPVWGLTAIGVAVFAALYFSIASVSLVQFGINTPIWFSNAVAVVWLLTVERRRWPVYLAALYVVDVVAIQFYGSQPSPLLSLADLVEVIVVALLVARFGGAAAVVSSVSGLARFVAIAVTVPLFSSAWGSGVLTLTSHGSFWGHFWPWYSGVSLGMLVICPALMILTTVSRHDLGDRTAAAINLLLLVGLAALAVAVSGLDKAAYLLITFPALLMLVWRAGLIGASLGSGILIAVGLWRTFAQQGAFAAMVLPDTSLQSSVVALQIYLAALTLSSLPLAVVLTEQRRLARELFRVADARSDFLAAMSHEIRTPMTGVLGLVDLLDSEAPTPRQRERLASIRASGKHLVNILNDILDFSRLESGNIVLEGIDFSLPLLLEQVQDSLQPLALERGITLSVGMTERSPPIVRGDPTRIQQILLNLTGNAIKFTPKGSVLVLAAYCPDQRGPRFRFEVRDTGIGLAADQQLQIFDAFTQADHSTSRRYGGSGLGLAISKRLAEMMQGEIGVESTLDQGSLFWFEIPLELGDIANFRTAQSPDSSPIVPCRVLLAEDVELNRDIISTFLARDGHHVVVAENGSDAVEQVRKQPFDLILMDIHMPVMDGLDATRAIRAMPGLAGTTPIVALTANVMASEQEKCREAGMDSVLMKPIEWEKVRATIRDCGRLRDQNQATVDLPPGNAAAEGTAFDHAIFAELQQLIPAVRLRQHAEALSADVGRLADATPGSDPARIRDLAHGIVSQAGMLGLIRLSSRAAEVEQALETGQSLSARLRRFRAASADPLDYLLPRLTPPPFCPVNLPSAEGGARPAPAIESE